MRKVCLGAIMPHVCLKLCLKVPRNVLYINWELVVCNFYVEALLRLGEGKWGRKKCRRIPKCGGDWQGRVPKCSLPRKLFKTRDLELPIFEGSVPSCSPHSAGYTRTYTRTCPWPIRTLLHTFFFVFLCPPLRSVAPFCIRLRLEQPLLGIFRPTAIQNIRANIRVRFGWQPRWGKSKVHSFLGVIAFL